MNLQTVLVPNKKSPGYSVVDAQESDLDLQWSSAVARGASLIFVYSYDVLDAVQYAIDQNLAPVISMSYGECEESDTKSGASTMRSWAKQAIAQGITWVAASGDSGAAACYESSGGPFGPASDSLASGRRSAGQRSRSYCRRRHHLQRRQRILLEQHEQRQRRARRCPTYPK